MTYTLSYYKPVQTPRLKRRPWWAFWRHDELVFDQTQVRVVHCSLPKDEVEFIQRACQHGWTSPEARVIKRLMGGDATMVQLEMGGGCWPYLPTEALQPATSCTAHGT